MSLNAIEELLKQDTSLSYRLLRSVNSAAFGLRREIRSIREALLLLGLPMEQAIADLPVADDMRAALLGGNNDARRILDAVTHYERGEWLAAAEAAAAGTCRLLPATRMTRQSKRARGRRGVIAHYFRELHGI